MKKWKAETATASVSLKSLVHKFDAFRDKPGNENNPALEILRKELCRSMAMRSKHESIVRADSFFHKIELWLRIEIKWFSSERFFVADQGLAPSNS